MITLFTLLSGIYLLVSGNAAKTEEGIRVYRFDTETARTEYISGVSGIGNPTFVWISKNKKHIYAVGEGNEQTGSANALAFDKKTGKLQLKNTQRSYAGAPCNIILTPREDLVYTANYSGGSITQYPVKEDGTLDSPELIPFTGKSVVAGRQDQSHLHAVNFTPDGRFLMANDLGTDKIHIFPLQKSAATPLDADNAFDLETKAGMGPRHLCWAPNRKFAYLIGELSGEVATISYSKGKFSILQYLMADDYDGAGSGDIHISPDGRFVYASHRLKGDGISIMAVQPDGTLRKVGYQLTGIHPRNFTISPDGRYLLVACRDSNQVEIYSRDKSTGLLSNTGKNIHVPAPMCLQWLK